MTITTMFKINGTAFLTQPTSGRWLPNSPVGITGDGHPIYPAVHQFELRWSFVDLAEVDQLRTWFDAQGVTTTYNIDLPKYDSASWVFQTYSGCALYEPERGPYFSQNLSDYVMIVGNINVS